jgi:hypothetical protein
MIQQADKLLCESWNERMWSDGDGTQPIFRQTLYLESSRVMSITDVRMRRRPALFQRAALVTFSGPACSIARHYLNP